MSPARKRPRTYDPAKIRTAVLAQFANVRDAVRTLGAGQLALQSRLGDWTVRELVVHIAMTIEAVNRSIDQEPPATAELSLRDWPFATAACADAESDRTRAFSREHPDLDALYSSTEQRFAERLALTTGDRLLPARSGAMNLADYLVTRTVELVVHTDDLNTAVPGLDVPYDRRALAACTRLLADSLAVRAPGGSTEVRVPPYAVVQCVEGPRHTRGTPPNVVESDPLTWIRLATGREEWAIAVQEAHISASGERADLSGLLPLMG